MAIDPRVARRYERIDESEPSLLGAIAHLLAVGTKPTQRPRSALIVP